MKLASGHFACDTDPLLCHLRLLRFIFVGFSRSRRDLLLENLGLRQQLAILNQSRPQLRFAASQRQFREKVVGLVFGPNSRDLPANAATATVQ